MTCGRHRMADSMATSPPKSRPTRAKIEAVDQAMNRPQGRCRYHSLHRRPEAVSGGEKGTTRAPLSARPPGGGNAKSRSSNVPARGYSRVCGWTVDAAWLGFMLFWTRSGVEGEDHLESVVRADALLCLECRKLLGVGRKAWILSSKEHGHAPPWHDPVLKAFEGHGYAKTWQILSAGHRRSLSGIPYAASWNHSTMSGVARFCRSQTGETACCRLIEGTGLMGRKLPGAEWATARRLF
jgi:hypothetical protein